MKNKVVTFGEIMMRLQPPDFLRLRQAHSFDIIYGGGEANVAVSLANYHVLASYVTRLPDNDLGDACEAYIRQYGVDTSAIVRGGDRLGLYFIEAGAAQRGSKVIYDRAGSSLATIQPGMIAWDGIFADADWFHWTGITPAVSSGAADACLEAIQKARAAGVTISSDFNYRKNLWKWGKKPSEVMPELVNLVDVAICNEEDAEKVFGIKPRQGDVNAGKVEAEQYRYVAEQLAERFPNLKTIAFTLRGSISASHNTWSGVLWQSGKFYTGRFYDINPIIDRVGGGDAFSGGLIYGLRKNPSDPQFALEFAIGASCLKHGIVGDFNGVSADEVEKLIAGDASGRVSR
jgi:2-dehydro-3-deoxygluconokinase